MIKRSDFWVAILILIHFYFLEKILSITQHVLLGNYFKAYGFLRVGAVIRVGMTMALTFLFFNSQQKIVPLLSTTEKTLNEALIKALKALVLLISFVFISAIFPSI